MFNNMKLRTKIALGFAAIIAVTILIGGITIVSMGGVQQQSAKLNNQYVPEVEIANNLERWSMETMYEIRGYALTREQQYIEQGRQSLEQVKQYLKNAQDLADKHKDLVKLREVMGDAVSHIEEYEKLVNQTEIEVNTLMENRKKQEDAAVEFISSIKGVLSRQTGLMEEELNSRIDADKLEERLKKVNLVNEIMDTVNGIRIANLKSQAYNDLAIMQEAIKNFDILNDKFDQLRSITRTDVDIDRLEEARAAADNYRNSMNEVITTQQDLEELDIKRNSIRDEVLDISHDIAAIGLENVKNISGKTVSSLEQSTRLMIIGFIIATLLGMVMAYVIVVGITRPINRIVEGMSEGAQQVAAASEQLSSSSQQLAEGSTEQASSLEETSSTLEEAASMVQQNTENTKHAAALSKQAKEAAEKGTREMQKMMSSMDDIKKSSDQISKIIKVIDEIAFQTNILALNAAVEAARAGEAGMGFAVVAEEVRNLAQRSAQAAKDTANIIEKNIDLSDQGVEASRRVNEVLEEINLHAQKVNELLEEVAAASQEQSQGIIQINKAVAQMDEVVQENAASAEESASASEELSAQAQNMKNIVDELILLIEGGSHKVKTIETKSAKKAGQKQDKKKKAESEIGKNELQKPSNKRQGIRKDTHIVNPEDVIPLEEDMKDF